MYQSESGRLVQIIRRIVGNRDDAEDIVQDAFLKLRQRNVEPESPGILVVIARQLALDGLRAKRVRQRHAGTVRDVNFGPDAEVPADSAMGARQELDDLFEALKSLPTRRQQVFLLSRLDGLSHAEIARRLEISLSTVEKDMRATLEFCQRWREKRDPT